jgi:Zn-dependent M28 family amino/carboxypeptidase
MNGFTPIRRADMRKLFVVLILLSGLAFAQAAEKKKPATAATASSTAVAVPGIPARVASAMNAIDAERIRTQVKFLSDDLLEGRGTGQRGGDVAARYLASQFELYGLKPAGDNGGYLQKVQFVGVATDPQATTFALVSANDGPPMQLKFADDYVTTNESQTPTADIDAPIVFVGYGIDAPEYGWNDYKDADVRGKVLLMFVNEPPSDDPKFFTGPALTYYGRWTYKYEEAARKGAVGVILIHKTEMASYGWEVVRNSWSGEKSYLHTAPGEAKLKAASWVQLEVARKALAGAGLDLDNLFEAAKSKDFKPVPLPLSLKAHVVSRIRNFQSSNVLAVLPGTEKKEEAVIYTAHYDHFGIRADQPGDNIYNGALDNATGCAMLLELARAWSLADPKPKRSIYFAAVTAEEQGLLGSRYLGEHPPIAAHKIQLDLNYDDVKPYGYPEQLEVVGYDRTTFAPTVERVAKVFRLAIMPDAAPSAGHYYRSDHFSMARVGVPAFSVNTGRKYRGKSEEWGNQMYDAYTAKDYHHPSDEYRPDFDFTANAVIAKFGFALGWMAATQPANIGWQKGDEFEKARMSSKWVSEEIDCFGCTTPN